MVTFVCSFARPAKDSAGYHFHPDEVWCLKVVLRCFETVTVDFSWPSIQYTPMTFIDDAVNGRSCHFWQFAAPRPPPWRIVKSL